MFEYLPYYACCNLGNLLYEWEDYQGAIINYTQAIEIYPREYSPYYDRGITYNQIKDYAYAVEDFTQVIRFNPQHAPSYAQRACARMHMGETQKALEDCNRALQLDFNNIQARYWRGKLRTYLNNYQGAREDFSHLLTTDSDNWLSCASYNLGALEYLEGNNSQALKHLTKVIYIDPNSTFAYYLRGNAFYELDDQKGAFEDFEEAKQLEMAREESEYPNSPYTDDEHGFYGKGLAQYRLENPEEALKSLREAQVIALKHGNMRLSQKITDLVEEIQSASFKAT
ncbi:MAG: hypothetical protein AAF208_04550 [Cyanobacteria bacterium P01_A01_bin.45]